MELSLFREHFARIPRHVAVLGLYADQQAHGVTISSLQSVSVNEHKQVLAFVLKKNSSFSQILIEKKKFTINLLAEDQEDISKVYSDQARSTSLVFNEEVWARLDNDFIFIKGANFSFRATFVNSLELEESNIHFVIADEIIDSNDREMLLYGKRSYGVFQEWKNP
jgi:flavin reductase (DIM6/NTAB) family NADH-FMN oxidoreductase RutF